MFYCMTVLSSLCMMMSLFIIQVQVASPDSLTLATAETLTYCPSLYPHDQEDVLLGPEVKRTAILHSRTRVSKAVPCWLGVMFEWVEPCD